jgi:hypothetical protein
MEGSISILELSVLNPGGILNLMAGLGYGVCITKEIMEWRFGCTDMIVGCSG